MDFVLGYRVMLSNNHPCDDICNDLSAKNGDTTSKRGVYPKDFAFKGWHPQCRCVCIPILASEDEFVAMRQAMLDGKEVPQPKGVITAPNADFTKWVRANKKRIDEAASLPYFIRDNSKAVSETLKNAGKDVELEKLAKALGIEVGEPMTHEQADQMRPNPNYANDEQYRVNCQSAVVAYELRRRGLDVEALGNTKGSPPERLSYHTESAWIGASGNIPVSNITGVRKVIRRTRSGNVYEKLEPTCTDRIQLKRALESDLAEEGRYHIKWFWMNSHKGHIITAERTKDGLRYYDPQSGKRIMRLHDYVMGMDVARGIKWLRVDTLQANTDIAKKVLSKPTTSTKAGKAANGGVSAILRKMPSTECNVTFANGGRVSTPEPRLMKCNINKQEQAKFEKELRMAKRYAETGHKVDFTDNDEGSFDLFFDGVKADFKSTASPGNVVKYAKHAIREQGADIVLFEFGSWGTPYMEAINKLKRLGIHGRYLLPDDHNVYSF